MNTMITVPPFDTTQAKSLQSFLDAPSRSPESMGYAKAAGFLFAVACAPELIQPSEWLPIIIDPDNAAETSLETKKAITGGLMSLFNEMSRQIQQADTKLPPDISFHDDAMANLESDASISQWARGFTEGYYWLEKMWSGYIPDEVEEEFGYQLTVLCFFSSRKMAVSLYADVKNEDVTLESMADNMQRIFPDALRGTALLGNAIHEALASRGDSTHQSAGRGEKVGRNDPCPCGSGKKYKKCCASAQH